VPVLAGTAALNDDTRRIGPPRPAQVPDQSGEELAYDGACRERAGN